MSVVEDLRAQPLFAELEEERLEALAGQVEQRSLAPGEELLASGAPLAHFVLLAEGRLSTTATLEGAQLDAGYEHHAPTYLGAIQLLSGGLQTGVLRAIDAARVLLLPVEAFFELLRCEPEVARTIFSRFAPVFSKLEGLRADREKLVALGGLAAGLAHELNNPAAAAARGAAELGDALTTLEDAPRALAAAGVTPDVLARAREALDGATAVAAGEDALAVADREDALGGWLDDHDVPGAWDAAATLAEAGLTSETVAPVVEGVRGEAAAAVLGWLAAAARARAAAVGVRRDARRISELVQAVKDYSRLDRAPEADVDVEAALESTLTMLGHRLKDGRVRVARAYAGELPRVPARASELNQVFTNLLVNALDAIAGDGTLTLRTRRDGDAVLVEVADSGPGVPQDVRRRIFEPFFTTKPVGVGTGLGLDISHRIVAQHGGSLVLCDETEQTTFRVRLPVAAG